VEIAGEDSWRHQSQTIVASIRECTACSQRSARDSRRLPQGDMRGHTAMDLKCKTEGLLSNDNSVYCERRRQFQLQH
jgi:hypothetical protein